MLEKKIRRYKVMDAHREMVKSGQLKAAKILLKLLRNEEVHLGLDDDSWLVEKTCEELGCHIHYSRNGYSAIVKL